MNDLGNSISDRCRGDTKYLKLYNQVQETWAAVPKEKIPLLAELEALGVPVRDGAWMQKKTL